MAVVEGLALYHYSGCGYCARVRSAIETLGIEIELRNIHEDDGHSDALFDATGRQTVPCLRIAKGDGAPDAGDDEWMHESSAIIAYLKQRFGDSEA